ncbi:DUF4920 domain-containing protein [Yeosuana marina]|uniref:DUF4920 domain-containing protein n=1 Tax=Yeosuana marina TaxID=1565536 RepID=UPI00141E092B|nr:DUF4920 domain-containing protein [Yeosuana marina]
MKPFYCLILFVIVLFSCKNENKSKENTVAPVAEIQYKSFGKSIIPDDAIAAKSMAEHYKTMALGDSINTKIIAKVDEVCQAKGCWMKVNLGNDEQVMVKFKDYGFFMPKNIAGEEVIINGKAFVEEVSVDEQRHFAEDAGASPDEIAAIIEPKKTLSLLADGVLLIEK